MIELRFDVNLSSVPKSSLVECIPLMKENVHKIEKGDLKSKEMDR
jgi:hypothetical protein